MAILATWGLSDHAATGSLVALSVPFDVVHLGAAAVWLGGPVMVLAVALPAGRDTARAALRRFSQWALAAVVAIVATGVFAAWRQVGVSWGALTMTPYGKLVLYKSGALVVLVAIASVSRTAVHGGLALPGARLPSTRRTEASDAAAVIEPALVGASAVAQATVAPTPVATPTADRGGGGGARGRERTATPSRLFGRSPPRASRPSSSTGPHSSSAGPPSSSAGPPSSSTSRQAGDSRLRNAVGAEIIVGVVVLALTALLVNARPAKQAYAAPFSTEVKAGPTLVNLVVDPARAGPLTIHLYVLTAAGLIDNVPEVTATMTNGRAGISGLTIPLRFAGPGHFIASGFDIPIAGTWTIRVLVRTTNIDAYFADPITVHIR